MTTTYQRSTEDNSYDDPFGVLNPFGESDEEIYDSYDEQYWNAAKYQEDGHWHESYVEFPCENKNEGWHTCYDRFCYGHVTKDPLPSHQCHTDVCDCS